MTQEEYKQKKRECWEEFMTRSHENPQSLRRCFDYTFDRAYALGKEKETIAQEDIEKVANECVDNYLAGYRIDEMLRSDLQIDMINLFKDAVDFTLDKETKDAEGTVISGWVGIDEAFNDCYLHTDKPTHRNRPIADTGDYESFWDSDGKIYLLDAKLFPNMDSDSDTIEVEIIIKRKKK